MKTLVIVRHGDANRDDITLSDAQRPLTPLGRRETSAAAAAFATLGRPVDAVVSSPATRALDTADIWQNTLKIQKENLRTEPDVYEAERGDMIRIVRQLDDADDAVVLVGHNPGVTALLHHLAGRGVEMMSPSSFAVISINVDRWARISLRDAELVHYYAPPVSVPAPGLWQRFVLWKRQRVQKVELFYAFFVGLILILGVIVLLFTMGTGSE